jgi:hypothetical protein
LQKKETQIKEIKRTKEMQMQSKVEEVEFEQFRLSKEKQETDVAKYSIFVPPFFGEKSEQIFCSF